MPSFRIVPVAAILFLAVSPAVRAEELLSDEPLPTRALVPVLDASAKDDAPRGDGRRTLSRFVPNLGRNVVGVFSRDSLRPLAFGLAATALGKGLDDPLKNHLQGRAEEFGEAGQNLGGGTVMVPLALSFFAAGRFSGDTRFRAATYDAAQALVVTGLYTEALKLGASRTRPDGSDSKSFPSGHTSNAFALASVVDAHYGTKAGIAAYTVAGLIGVSRIERNRHYLSDVLAGATLGVIVGRTVTREDGESVPGQKHFSVGPAFSPSGDGLGVGVSVGF